MTDSTTSQADPKTYGRELSGGDLEQLAVNTIRALAMDGVQKAKSGHPGMPTWSRWQRRPMGYCSATVQETRRISPS